MDQSNVTTNNFNLSEYSGPGTCTVRLGEVPGEYLDGEYSKREAV